MNGYYNEYPYINNFVPSMARNTVPFNYGVGPINSFGMNPAFVSLKTPSLLAKLTGGGISNPRALSGISGMSNVFKNFSWSNLLNGTSKTLGLINQAIPVVHQIRPIWNNAKTMLRVMKAVNNDDTSSNDTSSTNDTPIIKDNNDISISDKKVNEKVSISSNNEAPTFFV